MIVTLVCTGNTCRSPMAARMLQDALQAAGRTDVEVTSAGTGAWEGAPASEGTYLVGLEHGLDLSNHRATLLTREHVERSDLILAMGRTHLARIRELGGGARAHLLGDFAGLSGVEAEIPDPFGGDLEEYRQTFRRLKALVPEVVARLARPGR